MVAGAPGSSSRGRGGKFKKFTRGGGKHFSRNLRPLDADGNEISMWSEDAQKHANASDDDEEDEEEDSDDESEDDSGDDKPSGDAAALSREERRQQKKARKEAAAARAKAQAVQVGDLPPSDDDDEASADDMPANPNHSKAARNQAIAPASVSDKPTRRERESMEAAQAKERYLKLQEQGKTDEAKADLARLRLIREKREAEAARKQAEKEAREAQEKEKRAEFEAKEAKRREAALGKAKKSKK